MIDNLDSLELLQHFVNGIDPRKVNTVYEFMKDIKKFYGDDDIPNDEFKKLFEIVEEENKNKIVTTTVSLNAAKILSEYKHAKMKEEKDVNVSIRENKPLTKKEIKLFAEKFNEYF